MYQYPFCRLLFACPIIIRDALSDKRDSLVIRDKLHDVIRRAVQSFADFPEDLGRDILVSAQLVHGVAGQPGCALQVFLFHVSVKKYVPQFLVTHSHNALILSLNLSVSSKYLLLYSKSFGISMLSLIFRI